MRSLIMFLWKQRFFLVFLFLEIISILLIFSNNIYQRSKFISASNGFTGNILSFYDNSTSYFNLREVNNQLVEENGRLRNELKSSYLKLDTVTGEVFDSIYFQHYKYIVGKVIGNSFQKRNNYLILSKGKKQGVYNEMGVLTQDGILGIVNSVSDNFCSVISVLHSKTAVDAKIVRSGYTGTITWDGKNYRVGQLENIPSHVKVHVGDSVITSGNSSIFPEGILLGKVISAKKQSGDGFYDIEIQFYVDYNKTENAYFIYNLMKKEEDKIMEGLKNEQ